MTAVKDKKFSICTLGIVILGLSSGIFALNAREYYATLNLPSFAPPGWLFGPVWVILYILMGITLYKILKHPKAKEKKIMLVTFILQFILNFIWSGFFFTGKMLFASIVDITLLWLLLFFLQLYFLKHLRIAMWLMGPYFLWVTFASILNYSVFFLN